jgi:hypothetical protein
MQPYFSGQRKLSNGGQERSSVSMLDNIEIDSSSYVVVKVDMVHENWKDLKLKVPPDDMTLTIQDAIT